MIKSRPIIAAILSTALVLPTLSVAEAGPRHGHGHGWHGGPGHGHWGPHHRRPKHRRHNNNGAALAAGIIGLAAGAVIIGALSQPRHAPPVRYHSPVRTPGLHDPLPVRSVRYEPWTPAWYEYCAAKYRSFKPATGTFTTYGGEQRFCR